MAIKDELIELNQTKQGIKTAFEEKGVDLQGKTFSDTPALIGAMNVGKGDEVESFAVGAAKTAQENDKVILNYAADMLPGETSIEAVYGSYSILYCDDERLYVCNQNGVAEYYERVTDWNYINKGTVKSVTGATLSGHELFIPYGLSANGTRNGLYVGQSYTRIDSNERGFGCLTYASNYDYACSGGYTPCLFKRAGENWSVFSSAIPGTKQNDTGYGIIDNKLLYVRNKVLYTYSFDNSGVFTEVGNTSTSDTSNYYYQYWRLFDNDTKAIVLKTTLGSSNEKSVNDLYVVDLAQEDGIYSVSDNSELTASLKNFLAAFGLNTFFNVTVNGQKIYIHSRAFALCCLRYEEGAFTEGVNPFPDISLNDFFINPVYNMAVAVNSGKDCLFIRYLDAPVAQKYVATESGDGLQFQSVSLTGFVKENNNGILTVSTVLDPNAVVPSYPDTYGLNVTVNAGHPTGEEPLEEGSIDISWGWFKSGDEYVKWQGTPSATFTDIEGDKAVTMGLWLVKDGETVKPVISVSEPTDYAVRHNVSNSIYLSDTLDYFLPNPYGLEASVQYGHSASAFEQPVLTANGTMGGDAPACAASSTESSYYAWKAFDGNDSTYWGSSSAALPDWLCFYNPQALSVTSVDLVFTAEIYSAGTIQGSNDNESWDDIGSFSDNASQTLNVPCMTSNSYKYIRVYFTAVAEPWGKVVSMNVNASIPFNAGSVTVAEGWQEFDGVRYLLSQTTAKSFDDVIVGDKATTMGLYLTKGGAAKENFTIIGAPVISDKAASFNAGDLIVSTLDFVGENPWEYKVKFTTGDTVSADQAVFGPGSALDFGTPMIKITGGQFQVYLSSNGTAWDISAPSATKYGNVSANTTYWIKLGWTGEQYYFACSANGTDFTTLYTETSSTPIYMGTQQGLGGNGANDAKYFRGTIDLSDTSFAVNNEVVWTPYAKADTDFIVSANAPAQTGTSSHYLQDVYLSNTLDYFVEEPQSESEV